MNRHVFSAWGLVLLFVLGSGLTSCTNALKQPDPAKRYYVIRAERASIHAAPDKPKLKVRRVNISTAHASRELVYRLGENEYATDYYNLFLVSPRDMLEASLRTWFEGSALFGAVLASESSLRPDYVLESSILELYGDFRNQAAPAAVVAIQFFLLRTSLSEYDIAFSQTYRIEVPLADHSAEALAGAYSKAMQDLLSRLETDIAALLAKR